MVGINSRFAIKLKVLAYFTVLGCHRVCIDANTLILFDLIG